MPFIVNCDGQSVEMPFDGDWIVPTLEGRFPNEVMLTMDEDRFGRACKAHAIWTEGCGNFATLAYCGGELTIQRHQTLEQAITAKRMIDDGGCGGGCCKVHVIVEIDPTNSRHTREQENIRRHVAAKSERPRVRSR
jgi:hypothetical protein